jgi:hypothetical protein
MVFEPNVLQTFVRVGTAWFKLSHQGARRGDIFQQIVANLLLIQYMLLIQSPALALIHRIHMNHPNQRNACTLNQTSFPSSNPNSPHYQAPLSSSSFLRSCIKPCSVSSSLSKLSSSVQMRFAINIRPARTHITIHTFRKLST